MDTFEYQIIKDYGTVARHGDIILKLRLIKWGNNIPKYDLRSWIKTSTDKEYAKGGITLTKDEIETLGIYINELDLRKPTVDVTKLTVSRPIEVEQPKKKRGRPAKSSVSVEEKKEDVKKEEKPKKNVIEFPKPKKDIEKMVTDGHATYAECIAKIEGFKAIYKDADSQYVLDGVLELCKVDKDFRNNVMREDKDYEGALDYMADMCQKGYAYRKGSNYAFIDRDTGLGFAIDYFNLDPKSLEKPKPKIAKVETTKPETKKRGRAKTKVV